jgi:uncharacterized membrane protein
VRTDGRVVWLNLFMLSLVCLVPFTDGLLNRYGDLATAVVIYAANLALLGAVAVVLRVMSWPLLGTPPSRNERRAAVIGSLLPSLVFALSIPIALWRPTWAEWSWLSLLVLGGLWPRVRGLSALRSSERPVRR